MNNKDIADLLEKFGHRNAKVKVDNKAYRITITTEVALDKYQQEMIESCAPAGSKVIFVTSPKEGIPIPESLKDWWKQVSKEIKRLNK